MGRPVVASTIQYPDGDLSRRGDCIDYDGHPAVVEVVIDTEAMRREWGVKESGLMLKTEALGLIFVPESVIDWESMRFVARGPESQ